MRVFVVDDLQGRDVDAFGSQGFSVSRIAAGAHVVCAHVDADGLIGRHDAVVDQLLVVISGRCVAAGADHRTRELGPGQAVLWQKGESHETRALDAVTALIIEARGLADNLDS